MNENTKMQILSNDTVRRLLSSKEDLGAEIKGYNMEQTRRILKNGIKGYIGRMRSREKKGLKLRSTANIWRNC